MTIDERLDRLAERHEALTQTVELLAVSMRETDERMAMILTALEQDAQNIRSLASIAESHERGLSDLEGS